MTGPSRPPRPEDAAAKQAHPSVRYERQDVDPGTILRFGAILMVVTGLVSLLLVPIFGWLRGREAGGDPPPPPMGRQGRGRLPPEPRLQVAPRQDLQHIQREAERALEGYGWVDEDKGIVRIPIEEAMRLLVEREQAGAPGPSAAPAPGAAAGASPGPSPSGGQGRTP
jgi:hypothetical protein